MDGPPKDTKETPYNKELREDLELTLNDYKINREGKEAIISAFIDKKSGRLIFTLDQNVEVVTIDASKNQEALTKEVYDILDKLKQIMLFKEAREAPQPNKKPDEIVVSFTALQ